MEYLDILACPNCRTKLKQIESKLKCDSCGEVFEVKEDIPILTTKNLYEKKSTQDKRFEVDFMKKAIEDEDVKGYDRGVYAGLKEKEYEYLFDEYLPKGNNKLLLDFGCGVGLSSILLANRGYNVIGIDIIYEALKQAKTILKPDETLPFFVVGDAEHTPFLRYSFDAIFVGGVLHHFPDYTSAIRECCIILKQGGMLVVIEPNWFDFPSTLKFMLGRKSGSQSINESTINPLSFESKIKRHFDHVKTYYPPINHTRYIVSDTPKKKAIAFLRNSFYTLSPKACSSQFFVTVCIKK